MERRGLVDALRENDEEGVWIALADDAPEFSWRYGLWAIDRDEGLRLVRRGGLATRVALSRHLDGRVREAAVRAMVPNGGTTLLALLRRANDWVPAVARLAQERAIASIPLADHADLILALPLVHDLTRQRRADHAPLVTAFRREVARRKGLAIGLRKANDHGALGLWTFRNLIGEEETLESLATEGLRSRSPAIQIEAARIAMRDPAAWSRLMDHPNPRIRRLGLDIAPVAGCEAALIDAHAGVRNDARYLLGKRDYAAHYRARLPEPGAVSRVGETGTPEDANALVTLLKHPKADVRARAVESIFRLEGDAAEALMLAMLLDPVQKVRRAAVEALSRSNLGFDPVEVLRWPLNSSQRRKLLERTPRWAALLAVLRGAPTLDGAEEWLVRWAGRASDGRLAPKPQELAEAKSLLETVALGSAARAALHDVIAGWCL